MFAGECWRTLSLLNFFNMQKLCRRLEINVGVSCAPFVNVPESWLKLYRICLIRTLLANVDWDAGGGEPNLTERLYNGCQRLPDAMNAMVTQGASVGTATACSNDFVSASLLIGLFIDTFFCLFASPCLQLSFTATKYTKGRWIDVATSSIKTRLPESFKSSAIYRRCLTLTSSLPTLSIRSSKLDYVGDRCTYLHLRWQKFAYANRK